METARKVTSDIDILPSYFPIPGFGVIPVNAFVLKAAEPVFVDTGVPLESEEFIAALESVIDRRTSSGSGSRIQTRTT